MSKYPIDRLKHHVTGAIERGEKEPIEAIVDEEPTYSIIRFYKGEHERETIATGLTREEAKEHCSDPDTEGCNSKGKYFDGFEEE